MTRPYAEHWPDARVLTLDGWGHTVMGKDGAATDGAVCAPDRRPFDPPPVSALRSADGERVVPQQVPVRPTRAGGS